MQDTQMPSEPTQPVDPLAQQTSAPGGAPAGPPTPPPPPWAQPPRRRSIGRAILLITGVVVLIGSIMLNVLLAILAVGQLDGGFRHVTISEGKASQVVAVYKVQGAIDGDAVRKFAGFYNEVKDNRNVKAVVLRVNSPGGGVSASDQIHHLVTRLQAKGKKVVVSMGAVAASGGYYISASADEIFAEPTTITGSIGVVMAWPVIRGTLEKIGMETVVIKSSHARGWKDEGSFLQQPQAHHRKHLQGLLDNIQTRFEKVVLAGRGDRLKPRQASYTVSAGGDDPGTIEITETEPLNGKVYLSDEAKQLGLIDSVGYLSDAIDRAAALAGLDRPRVVRYDLRRSLLAELLEARSNPLLGVSIKGLDEFQTPRLLMMWKAE